MLSTKSLKNSKQDIDLNNLDELDKLDDLDKYETAMMEKEYRRIQEWEDLVTI